MRATPTHQAERGRPRRRAQTATHPVRGHRVTRRRKALARLPRSGTDLGSRTLQPSRWFLSGVVGAQRTNAVSNVRIQPICCFKIPYGVWQLRARLRYPLRAPPNAARETETCPLLQTRPIRQRTPTIVVAITQAVAKVEGTTPPNTITGTTGITGTTTMRTAVVIGRIGSVPNTRRVSCQTNVRKRSRRKRRYGTPACAHQ